MSQGLLFILFAVLIGAIEACGPGAPRRSRPMPPRPMKRDVNVLTPESQNLEPIDVEKFDVTKLTADLFALFDHDVDGIVFLNEISTAREVESLTKVVQQADINGDGMVTLREFQTTLLS